MSPTPSLKHDSSWCFHSRTCTRIGPSLMKEYWYIVPVQHLHLQCRHRHHFPSSQYLHCVRSCCPLPAHHRQVRDSDYWVYRFSSLERVVRPTRELGQGIGCWLLFFDPETGGLLRSRPWRLCVGVPDRRVQLMRQNHSGLVKLID